MDSTRIVFFQRELAALLAKYGLTAYLGVTRDLSGNWVVDRIGNNRLVNFEKLESLQAEVSKAILKIFDASPANHITGTVYIDQKPDDEMPH